MKLQAMFGTIPLVRGKGDRAQQVLATPHPRPRLPSPAFSFKIQDSRVKIQDSGFLQHMSSMFL